MDPIRERIARHKGGQPIGLYSVCSAHPLVIEATLRHAERTRAPLALIEATSNQVNQDRGYTGMKAADFRDLVHELADRVHLPRSRLVLGGDHLGPNPWRQLPAEQAMAKADRLIEDYVAAGFRKIHLDCSMACAGDPVPLPEETVAGRAARLCAVAERASQRVGAEPPVYVIGTEVPVPGGAAEAVDSISVTMPDRARATIDTHRAVFCAASLADAWPRVIAVVVQPGVEFDHRKIVRYAPEQARALSRMIEAYDGLVFEAHSTDYQPPAVLAALVRDHFAILKVGPALTFALREALWALDAVEQEWLAPEHASGFRSTVLARLKAEPRNWAKYYQGAELDYELQYSLSDRIRYYWSDPEIARAQAAMFANLVRRPPPPALVSQYLPLAHAARRDGLIGDDPAELVVAHIWSVLDGYGRAAMPDRR